jgi:hypothetical protein
MAAVLEGHWAQSEAIVMDDDTFIPYGKKTQADMPTVSTAAPSSFAQEVEDVFVNFARSYVGACSSGVSFPSPFGAYVAREAVVAKAPAQEKQYIAGASSAGVAFPSPFAAPESRGSKAVPSDGPYLASSSAGVAFPSPVKKSSAASAAVVPVQGGLAGAAGAGVNFPSPFKTASAPRVSVPFSSIQGSSLAGCSSAGVSFPSPLVSAA